MRTKTNEPPLRLELHPGILWWTPRDPQDCTHAGKWTLRALDVETSYSDFPQYLLEQAFPDDPVTRLVACDWIREKGADDVADMFQFKTPFAVYRGALTTLCAVNEWTWIRAIALCKFTPRWGFGTIDWKNALVFIARAAVARCERGDPPPCGAEQLAREIRFHLKEIEQDALVESIIAELKKSEGERKNA